MSTLIHRRVEAARRGDNPTLICRTDSGWIVMGDAQVVRGYCLLLPDPVVGDLNALDRAARAVFVRDMVLLGDALLEVTKAARINYEILGNLEPALHAHVVPRYWDEPEANRTKPIWSYDLASAPKFDPHRERSLMDAIAAAFQRLAKSC